MHRKERFKQVLEESYGSLAFSKTKLCLKQMKVD
jgi:hypothetical protein